MKWTSLNDLRESFLSFFESKDHLRLGHNMVEISRTEPSCEESGLAFSKCDRCDFAESTVIDPAAKNRTCKSAFDRTGYSSFGRAYKGF